MRLQAAVLCDAANVREGLLNILSGGISRAYREELPASLGVVLALLVEVDSDQLELPHEVTVQINDSDGKLVGRVVGAFQKSPDGELHLEPGEDVLLPTVIDLRPVATLRYGRHRIRVRIDESDPVFLTLYVLHRDEMRLPRF